MTGYFDSMPRSSINQDAVLQYVQRNAQTFYKQLTLAGLSVDDLAVGGTLDVTGASTLASAIVSSTLEVGYLTVNAQDGSSEGGEATFKGAGSNPDWIVDVESTTLRLRNEGSGTAVLFRINAAEVARFSSDAGHNLQGLAWTTWSPSYTNLNVGSTGTTVARYVRVGNTVYWHWEATLGGTGISVGDVSLTPPVNIATHYLAQDTVGSGTLFDANGSSYFAIARPNATNALRILRIEPTNNTHATITSSAPFTWVAGDRLQAQGFYEAAV